MESREPQLPESSKTERTKLFCVMSGDSRSRVKGRESGGKSLWERTGRATGRVAGPQGEEKTTWELPDGEAAEDGTSEELVSKLASLQ